MEIKKHISFNDGNDNIPLPLFSEPVLALHPWCLEEVLANID